MMLRSLGVSVFSLALTTVVVGNAYYQKKQFYPSVVYITKSNPSMAVIYIQAFICVLLVGKIMRRIFFGQLRTAEFEHLMERSWYAITETCLAFTVFRDDFNPKFVALFTLLLFLKSFHWLAEDRVDYMERSPVISLLFHIRVLSLLILLGFLDFHYIQHAYTSTVQKGASVQLVFGFEYAILLTVVINIFIKYALHSVDLNSETPWDNKAVFLLYTELVMGLIKVILYVAFVAIMVRIYTLPLFAFRPMYYTIRNFKKAFTDVILSRRAIHNMNTLYPDATPEELLAADNVCIICREEMSTASKKLPCNHIFHTSCLRSWFQRQQTCPTCRLNILRTAPASSEPPRPDPRNRPPPPPNPFFNLQFGGGGPNPFNQMFINQPQAAAAAQHQQHPPPPNQAQGVAAAAGQTAPSAVPSPLIHAGNIPPFVFPPFPFMPFMAPPPMPPTNLRTLSPEELRRLEGNERENVEARIQCLRNIQVMLDAAVVMMQQYSAAASVSMQMLPGGGQPQPGASTSGTPPMCNGATPSTSTSPNSTVLSTNSIEKNTEDGSGSSPSSAAKVAENVPETLETPEDSTDPSPDEVVRKRRLQRFEQQQQ